MAELSLLHRRGRRDRTSLCAALRLLGNLRFPAADPALNVHGDFPTSTTSSSRIFPRVAAVLALGLALMALVPSISAAVSATPTSPQADRDIGQVRGQMAAVKSHAEALESTGTAEPFHFQARSIRVE